MNKKKEVKTVKIKTEPVLCNPEDYFQDLINDGFSIHEALMTIIGDELVHIKLQNMFPDGYEILCDGWDNDFTGSCYSTYVIRLTEGWHHDDKDNAMYGMEEVEDDDGLERELIASDEDMAHA
tara:strand:+ start:422 stop:790 length:369 start_codon:yes stop_codon:yes gene_type:complete